MKYLFITLLSVILVGCHKKQVNDKVIPFLSDSAISDNYGKPNDSLTLYFPQKIFLDSTKIEDVFFYKKLWSFSLYKINEPILCNYYLNKEVYRLIIDRLFSRTFIIRIEKNKDTIFMVTKSLNRRITYPFIKTGNYIIYRPPGAKKLTEVEIEKIKHRDDSIARIYNNTNYFVDSLICKRISSKQWNIFINKLDSINFWNSYPRVCDEYTQVDGSIWIIEGQDKRGYQFHELLSPFNKYNKEKGYPELFKYVVNLSGMDTSKFRFY